MTDCSWQTPRTAKRTWCAAAIRLVNTRLSVTGGAACCCHIQAFSKPHNTQQQQQQMPALTPRDAAACNCANTGRHANFSIPVYTAVSTGAGLHTRLKNCVSYCTPTTCLVTYACACCMPQIKQRNAYQLRVLHCGCTCWTKSTAKHNHRNLNDMQTQTTIQLIASKQTDAAASSPCCPTLQHARYRANTSALCCRWHSMLGIHAGQ